MTNFPDKNYRLEVNNSSFDVQISKKMESGLYQVHVTKIGSNSTDPLIEKIKGIVEKYLHNNEFSPSDFQSILLQNGIRTITDLSSKIIQVLNKEEQAKSAPSVQKSHEKPPSTEAQTKSAPAVQKPNVKPPSTEAQKKSKIDAAQRPTLVHVPSIEANSLFDEIIKDLNSMPLIKEEDKRRSELTVKDFKLIRSQLKSLEHLDDEQRRLAINTACWEQHSGGGLEVPLSTKNITERVDLFLDTYKKAKEKGPDTLLQFFMCFGSGGGCLTNRMDNLSVFAAGLAGISLDQLEMHNPETVFSLPISVFLEDIFSQIDKGEMHKEDTANFQNFIAQRKVNRDVFKTFILENIDKISAEFSSKNKESKFYKDFVGYLKNENIISKSDNIDWKVTLTALANSPQFVHLFNEVWRVALESLDNS